MKEVSELQRKTFPPGIRLFLNFGALIPRTSAHLLDCLFPAQREDKFLAYWNKKEKFWVQTRRWINPNGKLGGWVAVTADVDPSVYISRLSNVGPGVKVGPGVRIPMRRSIMRNEDVPSMG